MDKNYKKVVELAKIARVAQEAKSNFDVRRQEIR